jgi:hypothetical protein
MPDEKEFAKFQRIRLKHIEEMLGQLNQDIVAIHILVVERDSIKEYLGIR